MSAPKKMPKRLVNSLERTYEVIADIFNSTLAKVNHLRDIPSHVSVHDGGPQD